MSGPGLLRRTWDRTYAAAEAVAQKVLLPAGLFVLYYTGLGPTWILGKLLRSELLRDQDPAAGTFWAPAEGYEPDQEDCLRQS
jgi:hypothetical protein